MGIERARIANSSHSSRMQAAKARGARSAFVSGRLAGLMAAQPPLLHPGRKGAALVELHTSVSGWLRDGRDGFMRAAMTDDRRHEFTRGLYGWITHTELSSTDPDATRTWCADVLGWTFQPSFPTPGGDYYLFAYSDAGGGGIRQTAPSEAPGSTPTVHVEDTQVAYDAALAAGAESVRPPTKVLEGVCTAMVRAPGGVLIGFSGPTD